MSRAGYRDLGKERFWRRALGQWRRSGLTVRDYCFEHDLSEASFYVWRRTIAQRDQQAAQAQSGNDEPAKGTSLFMPIRVLPTEPNSLTTCTPVPLEVVLEHGRIIRIAPGFDAATLRQLLAVLEEASC